MKSIPSYLLHKRLFVLYFLLSFTALIPTNLFAEEWYPITPPNSPEARHGHSMITLPDGRVMMFGGEDAEGALFDDLHTFEDGEWTPITPSAPYPPARKNHQAWVYDDNMYVYGGYRDSDMLDDTWKYDTVANTWEEVQHGGGERPSARSGCTVTPTADGSAMLLGGMDTNVDYLKDLWKRNPDNTYEKLADSPYPLYSHSANLVNNDLLVVIGKPGYVGRYSLSANTWEFIANGPSVKGYHCTAQTVNAAGENIIFIFGGKDADGNESSVVYEYNVSTGVTTQRTEAMPQPIIKGAAAQIPFVAPSSSLLRQTGRSTSQQYNISVLVFGGLSSGITNNNTYIFTPEDELSIIDKQTPQDFHLSQNFPNPFNPATTIQFNVVKSVHVKLKVHNLLGKEVLTLIDSEYQPGQYSVTFNANQLTAGIYFYRVIMGDYTAVKKMVLLR